MDWNLIIEKKTSVCREWACASSFVSALSNPLMTSFSSIPQAASLSPSLMEYGIWLVGTSQLAIRLPVGI